MAKEDVILDLHSLREVYRLEERYLAAKAARKDSSGQAYEESCKEALIREGDYCCGIGILRAYGIMTGDVRHPWGYEDISLKRYDEAVQIILKNRCAAVCHYEEKESVFSVEKSLSHEFFYDSWEFTVHGKADPAKACDCHGYNPKWAGQIFLAHDVPLVRQNKPYPFAFDRGGMCGFEELGRAIATNTTLKKIDLRANGNPATHLKDARDTVAVLKGIQHASGVEELIFGSAPLGDEGLDILCNILRNNCPPLKRLSINSIDFFYNPPNLVKFQAALHENRTLTHCGANIAPGVVVSPEVSARIAVIQAQVHEQVEARKLEGVMGKMASASMHATAGAAPSRAAVTLRGEWDVTFFERQILAALESGKTKAAEAMLDLGIEGGVLSKAEQARFVMEISQRYMQEWSESMMAMTRDGSTSREDKSFHLTVMRRQIELWTEKYSDAASAPAPVAAAAPPEPPAVTPLRDVIVPVKASIQKAPVQTPTSGGGGGSGGSSRH